MTARRPCAVCGQREHGSAHELGEHAYVDPTKAGMNPMSRGRREFLKTSGYAEQAKQARGKPCAIQSPVCTGTAEHLHEPLGRGVAGGLEAALRDGPEPVNSCDACNTYVAEHKAWAVERGFRVSRRGAGGH